MHCFLAATFAPLTSETAKERQLYISHAQKDMTEWLNNCSNLVRLWEGRLLDCDPCISLRRLRQVSFSSSSKVHLLNTLYYKAFGEILCS